MNKLHVYPNNNLSNKADKTSLSSYALKSDLWPSGFVLDPNSCTVPFSIVNGWHSDVTNIPEAVKNKYATLITTWIYGTASTGNTTGGRMQTLIVEQGGGTFTRKYENSTWSDWA